MSPYRIRDRSVPGRPPPPRPGTTLFEGRLLKCWEAALIKPVLCQLPE
jgi:hypothetical protein